MTQGPDNQTLAGPRRPGRRKALIPSLVLVAAGALLGVVLWMSSKSSQDPETEAPPVNVEVEVVTALAELADTFELPGVVEANRVVRVSAEVEGRIERIDREEGHACQAGDPLIHLNTDLLQAECDRAVAQATYDRSRHQRISALYQEGATTKEELDAANSAMGVSQAALETSRARLGRAAIAAPIAGVLNSLLVEVGEYVKAGDIVAEIVDIETAKVVVHVPERDIQYVEAGAEARVLADVKGREEELSGTLSYISELADTETRATRVEISVDNRRRLLRSGQIVKVKLTRRLLTDVVMIPLAAVIPLEEGYAAYVVEDGLAQQREVTLGLIRGKRIQVVSGLGAGDLLIVLGHRFVGPGQPVAVVAKH